MKTQPKGVWRGGMVSNEWIRSIRMRMDHRVKRKYDKRSQSLTSHNSITTSSNPPCSFLLKVRMTFAEHTGTRGELKEARRPRESMENTHRSWEKLWQILKEHSTISSF